MKKLSDYANNVYSQYGEDGMIAEVLRRIGLDTGTCVEFGASDGLACSNTANLWRNGWRALLIEGNENFTAALSRNTEGCMVRVVMQMVDPSNIGDLLASGPVDLISIDIDGDDFFVFCNMNKRVKVAVVEYNKTIPPHLDLVPVLGSKLGIGAFTLKAAAEQRGYTLVGLTESNCIFVDTEYADKFDDIEKDLNVLMPPEQFMYLATDFDGRIIPLGHNPPWGLAWPVSTVKFRPNQDHLLGIAAIDSVERLIQAIERLGVNPTHVEEIRSAAMQIAMDMRGGYNQELRNRIERELRFTH
jgi:hypothetical protein